MTKEHPGLNHGKKKDSWHLKATNFRLDNHIYA